jgi:hypothetical protein
MPLISISTVGDTADIASALSYTYIGNWVDSESCFEIFVHELHTLRELIFAKYPCDSHETREPGKK